MRNYQETENHITVDIVKISEFNEIRIDRIEDKEGNFKAMDIRQWYCTRTNPEMAPTQKGIRLYKENIDQILKAVETGRH